MLAETSCHNYPAIGQQVSRVTRASGDEIAGVRPFSGCRIIEFRALARPTLSSYDEGLAAWEQDRRESRATIAEAAGGCSSVRHRVLEFRAFYYLKLESNHAATSTLPSSNNVAEWRKRPKARMPVGVQATAVGS